MRAQLPILKASFDLNTLLEADWPIAQSPAVGDLSWALLVPHPDSGSRLLHYGSGAGLLWSLSL